MLRNVFIFMIAVAALIQCTTKKAVLGPMPKYSKQEIYQVLVDRNIDFTWFSGKCKTSIDSPDEKVSGDMNFRVKKDSIIWVAVKKLGIEFARVQVDKKKYTILYRFEGVYETNPIDKLNEIFTLAASFEDAQQLLFGNIILPDSNQVTLTNDSIYYVLHSKVDGLSLQYYVHAYHLQLEKMVISDQMNRTVVATYGDYKQVGNIGLVAHKRQFLYPYNPSEKASIELTFSEFEVDIPKEIKFSIPDNYERIN